MNWLTAKVREKTKEQNQLLGKMLRNARRARGMTLKQAAAQLGRDHTFLTRIERGSQQATFAEVEQLAQTYEMRLADFETIAEVERLDAFFRVPTNVLAISPDLVKKKRTQRKNRTR